MLENDMICLKELRKFCFQGECTAQWRLGGYVRTAADNISQMNERTHTHERVILHGH